MGGRIVTRSKEAEGRKGEASQKKRGADWGTTGGRVTQRVGGAVGDALSGKRWGMGKEGGEDEVRKRVRLGAIW